MPDHFYTTDAKGELALVAGYQYYGIACYVYDQQVKGTVAVYRAFHPSIGDHFYTTSRTEFDNAVRNLGYKAESVGWFMFDKPDDHIALNRFYSSGARDHLYCTVPDEAKVPDLWTYSPEGVAGYVLSGNEPACDGTRAVPLYWWYLP